MQEASAAEAGEAGEAGAFLHTEDGSSSDPGNDVIDEVSVDPDHIRHPPVAAVFDDDRHP